GVGRGNVAAGRRVADERVHHLVHVVTPSQAAAYRHRRHADGEQRDGVAERIVLMRAALVIVSLSGTALAQPAPAPPTPPRDEVILWAPVADTPVATQSIPARTPAATSPAATTGTVAPVTISTMPVTKEVPGGWDDGSRTGAWIATGIAGGVLAATVGWYFYRDRYTFVAKPYDPNCVPDPVVMGGDSHSCNANHPAEDALAEHKSHVWAFTELGLVTATGAASLVAAYVWSRHRIPSRHVVVSAEHGGGTVVMVGSF